jgi:hypothetical protein
MDDRFLKDARQEPRPEFAAALRAKLQQQDLEAEEERAGIRWLPMLSAAAVVLAVVAFAVFPSVRASAQAFLDLFRVRNFAAVSVDPERLRQLDDGTVDLKGLLSDHLETLQEPGPPREFETPEAAGAAAGISLLQPTQLPTGFVRDSIGMRGPGAARLTVDVARLRDVMTTLGIHDIQIPDHLDGAKLEVHVPAAVGMHYRGERREVVFLQARSPEMSLPPGVDLAQVGEIGLRIAGLEPAEAKRFARSIDWHGTLLVPVPADASSFSEVTVRGSKALLVSTSGERSRANGQRAGSVLMWAEGDKVYALMGNLTTVDLVQMANSVQ